MGVILVVEDEEQVRVLAESFLQAQGHETLSAMTVEQALALLEGSAKIDLLFTDIGLPDDLQAGLTLAQEARALRPDLKVLYTSGQGVTDGMIAMFVPNGEYLPKPYTVDQLEQTLALRFHLKGDSGA